MRALFLAFAAGVPFLASTSCQREPAQPPLDRVDGGVEAARVAEGIRITNGTDQPIAYAVWARGFLGLFAPCTDTGPECPRLAPGASVVVPVAAIVGIWPGEREALVRWWHVVPDGSGGRRADEVRELAVPLSSGTAFLPTGAPDITGLVTAVEDSGRRLRVEERPEDASGSAKAVVRVPADAPILERSGLPRQFGEVRVGTRVSVWFAGPVAESYPVQATAHTVVIEAPAR
jgi:hypothetical protein